MGDIIVKVVWCNTITFQSVLNELVLMGRGEGGIYHIQVPSYCGCLGCSVEFFPVGSLQEVHVVV